MLRDLDLNRQNCNFPLPDNQNMNKIPLTNEHGDVFLRSGDYDDCGPISGEGGYEDFPPNQQYYNNNQRPSPVESDYFYDQYVDYPINDTLTNTLNHTVGRFNQTSPYVDFDQNKFNNNLPPPLRPPPSSQFTFFGHPLPNLSLGNVWGTGRTANNRASSGENGSRGKGRVQIFRPGDPELQVIVNRPNNDLEQTNDSRNREPAASDKNPVVNSLEKVDEKFYRPYPYFQTPFSQPQPEKGFSPMIPGSVGGFIPIQDPSTNETQDEPKAMQKQDKGWLKEKPSKEWPKDDNFKEIQLVTKSESQTKRTSSKSSSIGHVDKLGQTTISHLATSISPILSTLVPKVELITEDPKMSPMSEEESEEEESREVESRNSHKIEKLKFEEAVQRQNQGTTNNPTRSNFAVNTGRASTTEFYPSSRFLSPPVSSTTEAATGPSESAEIDETIENFNGSSSLSADHLIAPGSIISQEIATNKAPSLPAKAGKITKVFTPTPPASNSNEISKLLSPFYPQQFSSEPPTSFDNEYQPNQIYTQTFNENERATEPPPQQYERDDMDWYFNNYNQSQSNPILNYNLQPYDHQEHNSASIALSSKFITSAIVLIVIKML